MVSLKNIISTALFFSFLLANAEHEIGASVGFQKSNSRKYGIKMRNMASLSYRLIKEKNSYWVKGNYGVASTTQTLQYSVVPWVNPHYRTVKLNTSVSTIGLGYSYDLLHKQKNEICLGAEAGIAFLSDQYNSDNTRVQMGLFLQYSRVIFNDHLGLQLRLGSNVLGKAPVIDDDGTALYGTKMLLSLGLGISYGLGLK